LEDLDHSLIAAKVPTCSIEHRRNFGRDLHSEAKEDAAKGGDDRRGPGKCVCPNTATNKGTEGRPIEAWNGGPDVDMPRGAAVDYR